LLQVGITDGTEYQEFVLPDVPIIDSTVRLFIDVAVVVVDGDTVEEYRVEPRILDATPYDKSFELNKDGDGVITVNLGDGINGFLPPADLRVWAAYRMGGGDEGNVEADSIIAFAGPAGDLSITSSTEMTGGTEEETTEQIRVNAPRAYRTQNRAVTLQDFEDIALGVQGVGKANAVANSATSITIWVLGSHGVVASTALKTLVRQTIVPLALAGTDVTVANASLVPIDLGGPTTGDEVLIGVNDRYVQAAVSAAVSDLLLSYLSPDNRNFGERLSVSSLYALIRTVPGVDYVTIPVMIRQDVTPAVTTADIIFNEWEIPTAGNFIFAPEGGIV
jgi:predicted phage baseplate assembly protein